MSRATYQSLNVIFRSKPIRNIIFNQIKILNSLAIEREEDFELKKYRWYELEKNIYQLIQHRYYDIVKQQFICFISKYTEKDYTTIVERILFFSFKNGHLEIIDYILSNFKHSHLISIPKIVNDSFSCICFNGYLDIVQRYHNMISDCELLVALKEASFGNHLEVVRFLLDYIIKNYNNFKPKLFERHNPMNILIMDGHLELIIYIVNEKNKEHSSIKKWYIEPTKDSIVLAAYYGHLHVIKYIYSSHLFHSINIYSEIVDNAAENGHLQIIIFIDEYIKENIKDLDKDICFCTTDAMDIAAREGHLEIIKWLHENRTEGCTTDAMDYAAKNGHLEIVKWLHLNRTEGCSGDAIGFAVNSNHLEVVMFLHQNRTEGYLEYFADFDGPLSLEMIRFVNENKLDFEWFTQILDNAVKYGNLELINYLHLHRPEVEPTDETMDIAASEGHLDIVKWLHDNKTKDYDYQYALTSAAENGHLDIVNYFLEIGINYTQYKFNMAAMSNHLEVVKFLAMNNILSFTVELVEEAAGNGNLEMIEFLHTHYSNEFKTSKRAIYYAVIFGYFDIVKYLYENFSECHEPSGILQSASIHGQLYILEYLLDNGQMDRTGTPEKKYPVKKRGKYKKYK